MRLINLLICFVLLLCSISSNGQQSIDDLDKKAKKQYDKALKCLKNNDEAKGAEKIEEILIQYPDFVNARKKLASYYLKRSQKEKAMTHLLFLAESDTDLDPRVAMTLSEEFENNKEIDKAIAVLERLKKSSKLSSKQKPIVERRMAVLAFRKYALQHPVDFKPEPISDSINTENSEYLPAFNADGTMLIYTSRNNNQTSANPSSSSHEDLYFATVDEDGTLNLGQPITEINTLENEGAHTLSQDGRILIFTACGRRDAIGGCDLYISFNANGVWSKAKNLGPTINTRYWESQPFLATDNETLYYSSERSGGQGGRDIWTSSLGKTGWTKPKNLGPTINTKSNEESPFLHPDNKSFYFRSNGHIGMGNYDIFFSKKENQTFTEPLNLGYPINTARSEGALFVELNGNKAYYASDALKEENDLDILFFELPENVRPEKVSYLKLKVIDKDSKEAIKAKVELTNIDNNSDSRTIGTDNNGASLITINTGQYILNINKEGYLFHSENIVLEPQKAQSDPFSFTVELQKIETEKTVVSTPVILKNVFFETGSAELLASSNFEIGKLYKLLIDNPEVKIKIIGHTDNVGQDSSNLKLSEQRAQSVYDALIEDGIDKSRLDFEGKGEQAPIADNETEEGRQQNRRTEFVIIK